MMKKIVSIAAAFSLAWTATAYAGIAGTVHDMSGQSWNTEGEICIVCHTPHNADMTEPAPLWNHEVTGASFTVYTGEGNTLDADTSLGPGPVSLLCLSCHDGTVALDAYGGAPGSTFMDPGDAFLGVDLSDDHPIGFNYDDVVGLDPEIEIASVVTSAGLMLFGTDGDQMECPTCHDPHSDTNSFFLILDNAASFLCLTCHIK